MIALTVAAAAVDRIATPAPYCARCNNAWHHAGRGGGTGVLNDRLDDKLCANGTQPRTIGAVAYSHLVRAVDGLAADLGHFTGDELFLAALAHYRVLVDAR